MASVVGHYFAKRRVDAEEAEVRRVAAAQVAAAGPAAADACCLGAHAEANQPPPLAFVPRCCYEGDGQSAPPAYPIEILRNLSYSCGSAADDDAAATIDAVHVRVSAVTHRYRLGVGHGRHTLDIYFSPESMRQRMRSTGEHSVPVHVHVHGGGWQRGDKSNEWRGAPNAGRAAARHGFVSCCVSYRLSLPGALLQLVWTVVLSLLLVFLVSLVSSWVRADFWVRWAQFLACCIVLMAAMRLWTVRSASKVRHPESVLDVALAVAWVKAHVAEHVPQADGSRLFLSGHSAGAHLISLLAMDARYLNAVGLAGLPRDHIRGICAVSGIYLLHAPLSLTASTFRNVAFRAVYATPAFGCHKAALDDASPLSHASRDAPPVLLISAASDLGLEVDALRFAGRLRQLGVACEHHIVPHTSHASIASRFEKHAAHRHWFHFIDKHCSQHTNNNSSSNSSSSNSRRHNGLSQQLTHSDQIQLEDTESDAAASVVCASSTAAAEEKQYASRASSALLPASASLAPIAASASSSSASTSAAPSASTPLLAAVGDVFASVGSPTNTIKRVDSAQKKKQRREHG